MKVVPYMLKGKIVFSSTFVMVMMTFSVALILMIENLRFTEPSREALALLVYKLQIDDYELYTVNCNIVPNPPTDS